MASVLLVHATQDPKLILKQWPVGLDMRNKIADIYANTYVPPNMYY